MREVGNNVSVEAFKPSNKLATIKKILGVTKFYLASILSGKN